MYTIVDYGIKQIFVTGRLGSTLITTASRFLNRPTIAHSFRSCDWLIVGQTSPILLTQLLLNACLYWLQWTFTGEDGLQLKELLLLRDSQ